ncbi:hypothetical protein Tco_0884115, partial [Tanacetum coccineum]
GTSILGGKASSNIDRTKECNSGQGNIDHGLKEVGLGQRNKVWLGYVYGDYKNKRAENEDKGDSLGSFVRRKKLQQSGIFSATLSHS